ncbi:MAG: AmmeMemoRadiSam system protein A [Ignavibacteriales bacterium]|nr:AmmeMemoRadiSam system protein A [Ignavibacteriales bacterium]
MHLNEFEKRELLRLARESIRCGIKRLEHASSEPAGGTFDEPAGAFVTLRLRGELRGCIGYIEPRLPLLKTVEEVAAKAALEDPRFYPLTLHEFEDIDIEVSVLSPLQRVESIEDIEVGRHGVVLDGGITRGLLLPQVAEEFHWDRETFLRHTAVKAGLPPEAWNHPAVQLYTFTVEKFSESDLAVKPH